MSTLSSVPGRNDACPCGSGKKYKRCCEPLDRRAHGAGGSPGTMRMAAAVAGRWEMDVVPFTSRITSEPEARLAALLIVAGGAPIHVDTLDRTSPETAALANTLVGGLLAAGEKLGVWPTELRVRHTDVAQAMRDRLATLAAPTITIHAGELAELDPVARSLVASMTGVRDSLRVSAPGTWASWSLPSELVAALHRAAADFYRCAPWNILGNEDLLEARLADRHWSVCVLGDGGEIFGINLFAETEDFWTICDERAVEAGEAELRGQIIALQFEQRRDLSKAARREVDGHGWEIAGAGAYPSLLTLNSPAGGIRRRDAEDLLAVLAAVPAFLAAEAQARSAGKTVEGWRDHASGLELARMSEEELGAPDWLWRPAPLVPGSPQGPGADPSSVLGPWSSTEELAALEAAGRELVERFERLLAQDLARTTARRHADNAALLLDFLAGQAIPVRAMHEYDLRRFLYDWYPRRAGASRVQQSALATSLARFFAFVAAEQKVEFPWAKTLLGDRDLLAHRCATAPAGFLWDDAVSEWRHDLWEDLDVLVMEPDGELGEEGDAWGATMGPVEAALQHELGRSWLLWRDELLRAGTNEPETLRAELILRQREWERTAHPRRGGRTPLEAVREERREIAARRQGETRKKKAGAPARRGGRGGEAAPKTPR